MHYTKGILRFNFTTALMMKTFLLTLGLCLVASMIFICLRGGWVGLEKSYIEEANNTQYLLMLTKNY